MSKHGFFTKWIHLVIAAVIATPIALTAFGGGGVAQAASTVTAVDDAGRTTIREIVALLYADVPQELHKAAGMSVWSHLLKLVAEGQVEVEGSGPPALAARYRRPC